MVLLKMKSCLKCRQLFMKRSGNILLNDHYLPEIYFTPMLDLKHINIGRNLIDKELLRKFANKTRRISRKKEKENI